MMKMKGQWELTVPVPHLNLIKVNSTLSLACDSFHAALMSHSSQLNFMNTCVEWSQSSDLPANSAFVKLPQRCMLDRACNQVLPLHYALTLFFISEQLVLVISRLSSQDLYPTHMFCPNSSIPISTLYQVWDKNLLNELTSSRCKEKCIAAQTGVEVTGLLARHSQAPCVSRKGKVVNA